MKILRTQANEAYGEEIEEAIMKAKAAELVVYLNHEGEDYEYEHQFDEEVSEDTGRMVGWGLLFLNEWTLDKNHDDYLLRMVLDGREILREETNEAP